MSESSSKTQYELELSGSEFAESVDFVVGRLSEYLDSLAEQPSWNTEDGEALAATIIESIPESGTDLHALVDRLVHELIPASFNAACPGYLAYVPGGGIPDAAIADLIVSITNRYPTVRVASPTLVQLELTVIRWFCDMVGLGPTAGGFLTSGGSLANWNAIVAARVNQLGDRFENATIYCSDQTHHCILKSAFLAGIRPANVRSVATSSLFQIDIVQLEKVIKRDIGDGLQPMMVIGNAGSTNTGAIDDLKSLAELSKKHGTWFHIDAAYGGFFAMTERGKKRLAGIERADSIVLDPHKGMFLPYGTGCLLVRDVQHLLKTNNYTSEYMPDVTDDINRVDLCAISPELSRDCRAIRIWLPLKRHGANAFRKQLDEKLDLADWAYDQLLQANLELDDCFEIMAGPQLSTIAFRLQRPGTDDETLDAVNRQLLEAINAAKRVYLSGTMLDGKFAIRICVLSFRTHMAQMQECIKLIIRESKSILAGLQNSSA